MEAMTVNANQDGQEITVRKARIIHYFWYNERKHFCSYFRFRFRWHMVPSEWFSVQKVKLLRYQLFKAKFEHYELLCTENMTLSIYTCIHLFNIFLYILHIQHQNVLHYMFFDPNPTLFLKYKLISYIKFYYLIMQCYLFLWCLIFIVLY